MPVQISIVIVSYNVGFFLKQCLYSVYKAAKEVSVEIFVIDNNSIDDSVEMIKKDFPFIKLICNSENKGFAYACNQALRQCKGKYALLLNPDTIIQESTLLLCSNFMDEHSNAGALGVRMINGNGIFLAESKRSLPTPASAFYKMFGFSRLFPRSRIFGKYQLRYMNENEIQKVEVLSGAFMFLRKSVLDEVGLLDENFFMYGEDIDLSYRISLANYDNYYFPLTTIIHYKGESTKKSTIKYVKTFYNAMLIFATKHFTGKKKGIFRLTIHFAIYLRALLSLIHQLFIKISLPLADVFLIYFFYINIIPVWEKIKFSAANAYSPYLVNIYIPSFILMWVFSIFYFKGYNKNVKISDLARAILFGTILILAIYSLLPESYRYSRALIIIGAFIAFFSASTNRLISRLISSKGKIFSGLSRKKTLLIGNQNNESLTLHPDYLVREFEICHTLTFNNSNDNPEIKLQNLNDIVKIHKIECIIFFLKDFEISTLINSILKIQDTRIEFKIILPENSLMIGPQSVINLNSIPNLRINLISSPFNKLTKRVIDILFVILYFPVIPFYFIKSEPKLIFGTLKKIILGKLTWISYCSRNEENIKNLPVIEKGVFTMLDVNTDKDLTDKEIYELNLNYAKNYRFKNDIIITFRKLNKILISGCYSNPE